MPSRMNDRIAFSTEHFTVHRLDDPERPYRIDNGAGATRLGEPACVTIRMEYGKARIAWTGIGARDAGDARLFAGLVREACDVADRINHSREGRQAARLGDDYLESLGIER